jgi:hypothetical protein
MRRNGGVAVSAAAGAGGETGKRGSYYNGSSSGGAGARAAGTSRDPFLDATADEKVSTRVCPHPRSMVDCFC